MLNQLENMIAKVQLFMFNGDFANDFSVDLETT